jgi:hypothetical protein
MKTVRLADGSKIVDVVFDLDEYAGIEDDILITEDGPKNLSAKLPVSLEGLKKLMV